MSVSTLLRKEKDGTLYKYTKLSTALEDTRQRTEDIIRDAAASSKFMRMGESLKAFTDKLGPMFNQPKKPTSIKERYRRLLERRGDLNKTAEPPPEGVSVEKWDGFLAAGRKNAKLLKSAGKHGKNSAGFDLQGKTVVQGLPIAIENRVGSVREGKNDDGSKWRTKFRTPYGYLEGTKGADGDEIDVYVGPDKTAPKAFVVHQKNSDGSHDEDTVMLGFSSKAQAKKDILKHYDDKTQIGTVDEMPVDKLKAHLADAGGKKISKLAAMPSEQSQLNFRDGDPPYMTGMPARQKKRKGDVPTRMQDAYPPAKTENRQDQQWANQVEGMNSPEGFNDVGKGAEALGKDRALGDQPKRWEGPTRDRVGRGMPEKHRLQTATGSEAVVLNDISTSVGQDESKTSSVNDVIEAVIAAEAPTGSYSKIAMVRELCALNALTPAQTVKVAAEVTRSQAEDALKRLKELEKRAPTGGQLVRGAGIGALAGPLAGGLSKMIAKGPKKGLRDIAGEAASGAIYGGVLPFARHKAETGVEEQKLKEYVGQRRRGTLRGKIKKHVGI